MERLSCKLADVFERVDLRTWGRDIGAAVRFANWPFNVHLQRTGAILNTLVEAACQLPGIEYVACWGKFTGAGTSAGLIPPAAGSNDQRQLPDLLTCDALPCGVQHPLFIEYRKACSSKLVYEGYGFVGNAWARLRLNPACPKFPGRPTPTPTSTSRASWGATSGAHHAEPGGGRKGGGGGRQVRAGNLHHGKVPRRESRGS